MERCSVCGRELDPTTWTCPVCAESAGPRPAPPAGYEPPRPAPEPPPRQASPPFSVPHHPLPSGNEPDLLDQARNLGWNWGGFFTPYLWLIGHGRLSAGLLLILSTWIPFVAFIHLFLYPATALYLGFNGYELAWKSEPYHSIEQLRRREREWTMWGLLLIAMFVIGTLFFLFYVRAILEGALSELDQLGW